MKKHISIIAGFIVSVFLLWLAFRKTDFHHLLEAYSGIEIWTVAVAASIVLLDLAIRGLRWCLLIRPTKKVPAWTVIKLETMGLALNNVLPLRLGEVARTTIGANIMGIPVVTCLATIVVERMLDMMALSVIFVFAMPFAPGLEWIQNYKHLVWLLLGGVFVALAVLVFLDKIIARTPALSNFLGRHHRLGSIVHQAITGGAALRDIRLVWPVLALSGLLWMMEAFGIMWGSKVMNMVPLLTYGKSMVLLCVSALAVMLPSMPGYFGAYEMAIKSVLSAWNYAENISLGLATFLHITTYIVMTTLGIIFLYQMGHSLHGMWKTLTSIGEEDEKKVS